MRRILVILLAAICIVATLNCNTKPKLNNVNVVEGIIGDADAENEEEDGYDGAALREEFEFERIKDPVTGKVPYDKLWEAINYTKNAKSSISFRTQAFIWEERGPIYDSVGSSNGNKRGGTGNPPGTYTSGRIRAVIVDAADATGNTVWCGGVAGGLWKCTNFLSTDPNWVSIDDNFLNMAISSICQDPSNSNTMYFSTGEPTANSNAVLGRGLWKSTNHGVTWAPLASTTSLTQTFKVACDASGNLYIATRNNGLLRSTNGGSSFTAITPSGSPASCTDLEISSTGRLHASFGYNTLSTSAAGNHRYTDDPSTVDAFTWLASTGLPTGTGTANRIELAVSGNNVYATPTNGSNNIYATWMSIDGGATFTRMNAANYTFNITNTQGWYDITLAIDPSNPLQIVMGGLDMYRSADGGATITKMTSWVTTPPYIHADQHTTLWYIGETQNRMIIACDGGLFYSNNAGATWSDRNKNLGIKQFYSCALRPEAGSPYIIAGAQDNGVHQLSNPGKTYSFEVTGGDGGFVDISQTAPTTQFGSYIYNEYRRSTNGGTTWSSITFSTTIGRFINPFDYDELSNALYACYGNNTLLRWNTPSAGSTSNTFTVAGLGTSTAVTASPYTLGTVYSGSTVGQICKTTDANTASGASASANISAAGMTGNVNCINVGTTDNTLVAVMSNYGINNIWYTTNGGTSWSQIDGNLPDMPVRWAVFPPGVNDRLIIATEAGVYTSGIINGASTVWTPSVGFPTVRTDMLRVRAADNVIVAATHARGLWASSVLQVLPVRGLVLKGTMQASGQSQLSWTSLGATVQTRFHIQYSRDGINFSDVSNVANTVTNYKHQMPSVAGYYRVVADEPNVAPVISNIVLLRNNNSRGLQLSIAPNPVANSATMLISGAANGNYQWEVIAITGRVIQKGSGSLQVNTTQSVPLNFTQLSAGTYWMRVVQGKNTASSSFVKQ